MGLSTRALLRACGAALAVAALAGCAQRIAATAAEMTPMPSSAAPAIRVASEVSIRLHTGFTRPIPGGSRWELVGRLPQGEVFRPVGTVYAIEGRDVHEAYLVLRQGVLQGFYLPAESRYSPLPAPLSLPLGETR